MGTRVVDYFRHFREPTRTVGLKIKGSDLFWVQLSRLVSISVLLTGIAFGGSSFNIVLKDFTLSWYSIDSDLQLALLGFFNKVLDVLLVSSLEYTASVLLTTWMTAEPRKAPCGASFNDFDVKNELTKPWMTIRSFAKRSDWSWKNVKSLTFWKSLGSWEGWRRRASWKSFGRFVLCLCISVCVLLQGLAINTIAIPKERWFPNRPDAHNGWTITKQARRDFTITHPKVYLETLTWSHETKLATSNIGDKAAPAWAAAVSASRAVESIADMMLEYSRYWTGWQPVLNKNISGSRVWTGLNTTFDETNVLETLSVSGTQVWDVFQWQCDGRHRLAKGSTGWNGNLTLMVPVLNSKCELHTSDSILPQGTTTVNFPYGQSTDPATFTIDLGSIPGRDFPGAVCTFTFRQSLHSFGMWIIKMDAPDVSQNQYWANFTEPLIYQPAQPEDLTMARALAVHADSVLSSMDRLMTPDGVLMYLLLLSRKLRADIPAITSDVHGLTVMMGVLLQNMITCSDSLSPPLPTSLPASPDDIITSYSIQWQIVGSGPRLAWEWAAVFILAVILCCFGFGIWQTFWYRIAPGPWTEVPGMMMLAYNTNNLEHMDDEKEASKMLYAVETEPDTSDTMLWSWPAEKTI
ncbi:hypothetical protein E8E13_007130 [Curvularia kusanoi]|uniref:Uncharacterized protein n=1 Tax=Curvularia kusanoi TaxID=90978 RepID=A0A9P4W7K6_CURKU|nr:hypothetical protein E8E13_007130 [Curvularia kusanoi]